MTSNYNYIIKEKKTKMIFTKTVSQFEVISLNHGEENFDPKIHYFCAPTN